MSLPGLHCDPMQRGTRIAEASTTVPSLRISLLGWLHRSCTVGLQCHDVTAFNYLRFKQRLSSLEVLWENCLSIISQVSGVFLISPSCLSSVSPIVQPGPPVELFQVLMHGCSFATECNNPPGPEKTCLWSVTIRVLSSPFSFVSLIVPSRYVILELAIHAAAAAAFTVRMSIGHSFFVTYPNLTLLAD